MVALEAAYGLPSQNGFGSTVFYHQLTLEDDLTTQALERYKYFGGDLWERYGEKSWLGQWREVFTRPPGVIPGIVEELKNIRN